MFWGAAAAGRGLGSHADWFSRLRPLLRGCRAQPGPCSLALLFAAGPPTNQPTNRTKNAPCPSPAQVAGYRLHLAYRRQFLKLLQYISSDFLPALATSNDPDARAVHTRCAWSCGWLLWQRAAGISGAREEPCRTPLVAPCFIRNRGPLAPLPAASKPTCPRGVT